MKRTIEIADAKTSRGEAFLAALTERVPLPWDEPRPSDRRFADLVRDIDAMSSPSKLALLEAAATTLRPTEIYLEVGALFGVSTVAAARASSAVRMVVIDDFSQFGGSGDRLLANLRRYGLDERVELVVADYHAALARAFPPVGVYFFDGPHDYIDQYLGLELALGHLADEALVIVDDARWPHVRRANLDFTESHPALTLLCDLPSPSLNHVNWWNGLQVFEYRSGADKGNRDLRFHLNRARYAVLQPMKLYEIYYPHIAPRLARARRTARAMAQRARIVRGRAT